jgi:hypothetical protein
MTKHWSPQIMLTPSPFDCTHFHSSFCVCVLLCVCVVCCLCNVFEVPSSVPCAVYFVMCANIHTLSLCLVCSLVSRLCVHKPVASTGTPTCYYGIAVSMSGTALLLLMLRRGVRVCVCARVCGSMCNCVCVRMCVRPLCACVPRYPHPATTPSVWCYVGVGVCSLHVCISHLHVHTIALAHALTHVHTHSHTHSQPLTHAHPGVCLCVTAMAQRRWWRWGHTVPLNVGP